MKTEFVAQFDDSSGKILTHVYQTVIEEKDVEKQSHSVIVEIPDFEKERGMIVVGGGGKAWVPKDISGNMPGKTLPGPGAFLTASYPRVDDMGAWLVDSKDHLVADPHYLVGFAIGLKIEGMSRSQLRQYIEVRQGEPSDTKKEEYLAEGNHPRRVAQIPDDCVLISGGFRVNWTSPGNIATASFPKETNAWEARSKDHGEASPAKLDVWAIGLKEQLPVGRVKGYIASEEGTNEMPSVIKPESHPYTTAYISGRYALTGGGACVHWDDIGNLLTCLEPSFYGRNAWFRGASKDHQYSDPSTITSYALGIQLIEF